MKRAKYIKPKLSSLNDLNATSGLCQDGSGAQDDFCVVGNVPFAACENGEVATLGCGNGSTPNFKGCANGNAAGYSQCSSGTDVHV